ncbi:MAG: hypothetical protein Q7T21_09170 [Gallionella sp.]|nr:hypothetical protein [Gallionella sp.]
MHFFLIFLFLIFPGTAIANCAASPQDQYFCDFQILVEEIRAVGWIEEVCSEKYPHTKIGNQNAVKSWRARYSNFISEIESQFQTIEKYWKTAPESPPQNARTVKQIEDHLQEARLRLQQKVNSEDPVIFHKICEVYPKFLETPKMDLENARYQFVTTVRRGLQ